MAVYAVNAIIYIFIFIIGVCAGSFGNVIIFRVPRELSFISGRSFCPNCHYSLTIVDLIPIFGWIYLGGKCRVCGASISVRYPVVELASGGLAVLAAAKYGYTFHALSCFLIFFMLLVISFIDCEHMIIPDGLVVSLIMVMVLYAVATAVDEIDTSTMSYFIGFFSLSVPMLLLTFFIPDAFGGGDIKLVAVCGLMLGVKLVMLAGFIAVILGGIHGIYKKYIRKDTDAYIAFGQYICAGVFVSMLWGKQIIEWYVSVFIAA